MANTVISPNMNLPVPVVGVDPGPDWSNNVDACLNAIDSHNHTTGQGVPIPPSGLNINADLPLNGNNLTTARSVNFTAQSAPLSAPADLGCVYVSGVDLYYNDENGNQVRITQGGTVTGSSGTITGLPSGTASASFAGGTFTFQSATSTPANMAVGPLIIGRNVASSKTVTLAPNSGQASNYSLTYAAALPASTNLVTLDNTGAYGYATTTGSGSVVLSIGATLTSAILAAPTLTGNSGGVGIVPRGAILATFPNFNGSGQAYICTATTVADANGWVLCQGQTIVDGSSFWNGVVIPDLTNDRFVTGAMTSNTAGGNNVIDFSHTHNFAHTHVWSTMAGLSNIVLTTLFSANNSSTTTSGGGSLMHASSDYASGGNSAYSDLANGTNTLFTSGVASNANTGTGSSAATSSSLTSTDIRPKFLTAVYIMRIG